MEKSRLSTFLASNPNLSGYSRPVINRVLKLTESKYNGMKEPSGVWMRIEIYPMLGKTASPNLQAKGYTFTFNFDTNKFKVDICLLFTN